MLIFIAILVHSALNSKKITLHSIYLKIFVNYLQVIMIMISFKLNWPNLVKDFLTYQEVAGSAAGRVFTMDCLLQELVSLDTYFQQLIMFTVLPVITVIICTLFWTLKSFINRKWTQNLEKLVASIIIVMFLFHPEILRYTLSAFACSEIDANEYWLVKNLNIRCWHSEHSFYSQNFALPGLIIWGLLAPALVLIFIRKNHKLHNEETMNTRFGFLILGYKSHFYFWEFVIMYRKIGVVLI